MIARLLVVSCVLVLMLAAMVTADGPDGAYCGSYSFGLVTGKVTMKPATNTFDLEFEGLGANVKCADEKYVYHADSGVIEAPGAQSPQDCLGAVLKDNGLSLDVKYTSADDSVDLDLGLASLTATKC